MGSTQQQQMTSELGSLAVFEHSYHMTCLSPVKPGNNWRKTWIVNLVVTLLQMPGAGTQVYRLPSQQLPVWHGQVSRLLRFRFLISMLKHPRPWGLNMLMTGSTHLDWTGNHVVNCFGFALVGTDRSLNPEPALTGEAPSLSYLPSVYWPEFLRQCLPKFPSLT